MRPIEKHKPRISRLRFPQPCVGAYSPVIPESIKSPRIVLTKQCPQTLTSRIALKTPDDFAKQNIRGFDMGKGLYREKQNAPDEVLNIRPDEWIKTKGVKYTNNYDSVEIARLPRRFTDLYRN